jgi:hypothetical protein
VPLALGKGVRMTPMTGNGEATVAGNGGWGLWRLDGSGIGRSVTRRAERVERRMGAGQVSSAKVHSAFALPATRPGRIVALQWANAHAQWVCRSSHANAPCTHAGDYWQRAATGRETKALRQ